ncbi:MAG: glycogen synthase GlgA [Deltaproteobacteria bacterium]|nr:glycogen synthase GlgA [Deltaproteobacteria bacterium]
MNVVMAASELAPLVKTGGLGDVLGALPRALKQTGVDVAVILPAFAALKQSGREFEPTAWEISVPVSSRVVQATVLHTELDGGVPLYCIDADPYFDRPGLYGEGGSDYADNCERFVFFSRAVLEVLRRLGTPDLLHVHDWQAALAPVFLRADAGRYPDLAAVRTVMTVHNLGYQGRFWKHDWHLLNLDWRHFTFLGLEFYDDINFLKGGLLFADAITTVSPTYAREIQTPEHGYGLDGVLRQRAGVLTGILNGVDYGEWDPRHDRHIAASYSSEDLTGKQQCKAALQAAMGLHVDPDATLLGVVSRLAEQKGLDLLEQIVPRLLQRAVQLVVLGSGDSRLEAAFRALSAAHPGRMATRIEFDNRVAHQIEAGSDVFLMPSRYEPCGLNQMYSVRYGTVPVVRATGGLADSIVDVDEAPGYGTGFKFGPASGEALLQAIDRAFALKRDELEWRAVMKRGMQADFSWARAALQYRTLYDRITGSA